MEQLAENRCFGGRQLRFTHQSKATATAMVFSVYLPPQAEQAKVPVLYWLSGLTCTDENFVTKAGAQRYAAEHGVAIVAPDTSPRGDQVADDPEGAYDLGLAAGFYVDATEEPWAEHYQMYSYVVDELPMLLAENFTELQTDIASIAGHSMGGHGALVIGLRNPERYRSISAFAPISSPLNCPWGKKALTAYLGKDKEAWQQYDSCWLLERSAQRVPIYVDQGSKDAFLQEQLKPELLIKAASSQDYPIVFNMQNGYDHSYFTIATFIGKHLEFHREHLG